MIIWISLVAGILIFSMIELCWYDMPAEKQWSVKQYITQLNKRRFITLVCSIVMGFLFGFIFCVYGYGPVKIFRYVVLFAALIPIALKDQREFIIPNKWLIYLLICRTVFFVIDFIMYPALWFDNLKFTFGGGFMCGLIFLLAYIISKHAIGMGDVKLVAVIGMYLGSSASYLALVVSLIISAVYAGIQILRKKRTMKDEMPFGPFLAIGTILTMLIGA